MIWHLTNIYPKLGDFLKRSLNCTGTQSFFSNIHDNICRIGLRIQLFPSFKNVTPELKHDWEQELTKCSTALIKLLVAQYRADLLSIDQELISLQTQQESVTYNLKINGRNSRST